MKARYVNSLWFLLLLLLSYVPVFHNLDRYPIRLWDESRQTLNAKEMADNGHWLALYFEGEPETWNAKPPLMVICQALCIKVFGWNELAIRLPAALSAFATCLLLFLLFRAVFRRPGYGVLAAAVLLSFQGYVDYHAIRTGDFDAMLTLFITAAALCLYLWRIRDDYRFLYLFFLALFLGVMTKGIAALIPAPAYLIFVLWKGGIPSILKRKDTWLAFSLILLIPGYYYLREQLTPGYWLMVKQEELGGRFGGDSSNTGDFWFYLRHYTEKDLSLWKWFAVPAILLTLLIREEKRKWLARLSILVLLVHLLVISSSHTKLAWYDVPEYPFFAILFALATEQILDALKSHFAPQGRLRSILAPTLLLLFLAAPSYARNWHRIYAGDPGWDADFYALPAYLKRTLETQPETLEGYKVTWIYEEYPYPVLIYTRRFNEAGVNLQYSPAGELKTGDRILIADPVKVERLSEQFLLQRLEVEGLVEIYELKDGQGIRH